jgi:hypothetical protein
MRNRVLNCDLKRFYIRLLIYSLAEAQVTNRTGPPFQLLSQLQLGHWTLES